MVNDRSVYNHKMKQWQIQGLNMSREEQKEKADTKEYVTRRTGNNDGKKKSQRRAFNKCKDSNPDHIRELDGLAFAKSGKSNPQRVQEVKKNAKNRKRSFMSG